MPDDGVAESNVYGVRAPAGTTNLSRYLPPPRGIDVPGIPGVGTDPSEGNAHVKDEVVRVRRDVIEGVARGELEPDPVAAGDGNRPERALIGHETPARGGFRVSKVALRGLMIEPAG